MPFDVNTFRATLTQDFARANLFDVAMQFPSGADNAAEKLTFTCRSAQIPGETMGMIPIPYMGREIKIPGNRTFPEWTITIMNDEGFVVRNAFEAWMEGINGRVSNVRRLNSYLDYSKDATINSYRQDGSTIRKYKLIGCYPGDISPIEVDWGSNDTIQEYTVTLYYQWWEPESGNRANR